MHLYSCRSTAIRKCVAFFFAAAKDADIPLSPHIKKAKRGPKPYAGKSRKNASTIPQELIKTDERLISDTPSAGQLGWSQMLLSKFPTFDPAWSPEVQAKWFDSFSKLMKADPQKGDGSGEK